MEVQSPLWFAGLLAIASMAMVAAMVRFSRAWLAEEERAEEKRRWGTIYAALWLAILAILVVFLGDDLEQNLVFLLLFPLGWLALHALILRFGAALREATLRDRRNAVDLSRFQPVEEEEEERIEELPPPPEPTLLQKALGAFVRFVRWLIALAFALLVIGIGEAIPALHRLDAALMPHRAVLQAVLLTLVVLGFALFMGGIIHLILKGGGGPNEIAFGELKHHWHSGTWRDSVRVKRFFVIGGGVLLAITAGLALAVVFAPPGLKLLVLLVWAYAAIRIWLGWRAAVPRIELRIEN